MRRGFLRLWIVASLGWIAVVGALVYPAGGFGQPTPEQLKLIGPEGFLPYGSSPLPIPVAEWLRETAPVMLGPPLFLLVFGLVIAWVFAGFRKRAW